MKTSLILGGFSNPNCRYECLEPGTLGGRGSRVCAVGPLDSEPARRYPGRWASGFGEAGWVGHSCVSCEAVVLPFRFFLQPTRGTLISLYAVIFFAGISVDDEAWPA